MGANRRSDEMPATVIQLLEREWEELRASAALAEALRRWGSEDDVLGQFASVDDLVAFVHATWRPARERDVVLGALACRAAGDELAARVLLRVLLPGCKALVASFGWLCDSPGERAANVVGDIWARIRAFPVSPRPEWVATQLLGAARTELRRQARRLERERPSEAPERAGVSQLLAAGGGPTACDELAEILRSATDDGLLSPEQLQVIWDYRLVEVPAVRRLGASHDAIETRRLRAERKLRKAYAVCA